MSDTAATDDDGRDERGRFTPGNKAGRGHPVARRLASLRRAVASSATREDVREVMRALHQAAKVGDVQAAKVWLSYAVGRPSAAHAPAAFDVGELHTAADVAQAHRALAASVASGEVSAEHAAAVASVLGGALRAAELVEFDARLRALEVNR